MIKKRDTELYDTLFYISPISTIKTQKRTTEMESGVTTSSNSVNSAVEMHLLEEASFLGCGSYITSFRK